MAETFMGEVMRCRWCGQISGSHHNAKVHAVVSDASQPIPQNIYTASPNGWDEA